MKLKKLKKRKKKIQIHDLPFSGLGESLIQDIAKDLTRQIDKNFFEKKYATTKAVLILAGTGLFLAGTIVMPNLPLALAPFIKDLKEKEYEVWKRFNIPYFKRTIKRLEQQKLVDIYDKDGMQVVEITNTGRRKILKFAIDQLAIEKPRFWDRKWRLVSYDIPKELESIRNIFREYLRVWKFYPFHESLFLHAYPCEEQVEFLREYLGVGEFVRILHVSKIENDELFRDYFGV